MTSVTAEDTHPLPRPDPAPRSRPRLTGSGTTGPRVTSLGVSSVAAAALAVVASAAVAAVLLWPDRAPVPLPQTTEKVSGAALFDALTRAGPPGLAEELRGIAELLDHARAAQTGAGKAPADPGGSALSHAAAEAAGRLVNAAARLQQADASPTLLLASMADRLDIAMTELATGTRPFGPPLWRLLLAGGLAITAALSGLAALVLGRRARSTPTATSDPGAAAPTWFLPAADHGAPRWAEALSDRVAGVVREVCAADAANHQAAMAVGAQLASVAFDAEARLDAASRRAEVALHGAHVAETGWQERLDDTSHRLEQHLEQGFGHLLEQTVEQLAAVAGRVGRAVAPIAELSASVEQAALRLDTATERLDEAVPPLAALLDGPLPAAVGQLTAIGDRLEDQIATADAARTWLDYAAEFAARVEATGESLAVVGAALPARAEQAAGLLEAAAGRAAAVLAGSAEPVVHDLSEAGHQVRAAGRALDAAVSGLVATGATLADLSETLPASAEHAARVLQAAGDRAAAAVNDEAARATAGLGASAETLVGQLAAAGNHVEQAGRTLEATAYHATASLSNEAARTMAGLDASAEQVAGRLAAAGEQVTQAGRALEAAADRTATTLAGEAARTTAGLDVAAELVAGRLAAAGDQVTQAGRTLEAAAGRTSIAVAGEAALAAASLGASAELIAGRLVAAGDQVAQAGNALEAAADRAATVLSDEAARATASFGASAEAAAGQMAAAGGQVAHAGRAVEATIALLHISGQSFDDAAASLPARLGRAAEALVAHAGQVCETISAGLEQATAGLLANAATTSSLLADLREQLLRTGQQVEAVGGRIGEHCEDRLQRVGDGLEARIAEAVAQVAQAAARLARHIERQAAVSAAAAADTTIDESHGWTAARPPAEPVRPPRVIPAASSPPEPTLRLLAQPAPPAEPVAASPVEEVPSPQAEPPPGSAEAERSPPVEPAAIIPTTLPEPDAQAATADSPDPAASLAVPPVVPPGPMMAPELLAGVQATFGRLQSVAAALAQAGERPAAARASAAAQPSRGQVSATG